MRSLFRNSRRRRTIEAGAALAVTLFACACGGSPSGATRDAAVTAAPSTATDSIVTPAVPADSDFVDITDYSAKFAFDMRNATSNNFLHEKVYDCARCLIRYEVAKAVIAANDSLEKAGYRIRFFDCFRPADVQRKMWAIEPDSRYVANPNTTGSVHNRGAALDLTIEKLDGTTVDMGTDFDFFGERAYPSYTHLSSEVLANRKLLSNVMQAFGFSPITTEWWHFNYNGNKKYPISNRPLCQ